MIEGPSPLAELAVSTLTNLLVLVVLPFGGYFVYHSWRHKRGVVEVAKRAGLGLGEPRFIGYSLAIAMGLAAILLFRPPSPEVFGREGSAWQPFVGLGLNATSIGMAVLYGVLKTGFAEELLFRGLIAGSLSRRLPPVRANLLQALIFLAPHLLLLWVMPEIWWILPIVFFGALIAGSLRMRSGSIFGPWVIHAAVNVTTGLLVASQGPA